MGLSALRTFHKRMENPHPLVTYWSFKHVYSAVTVLSISVHSDCKPEHTFSSVKIPCMHYIGIFSDINTIIHTTQYQYISIWKKHRNLCPKIEFSNYFLFNQQSSVFSMKIASWSSENYQNYNFKIFQFSLTFGWNSTVDHLKPGIVGLIIVFCTKDWNSMWKLRRMTESRVPEGGRVGRPLAEVDDFCGR